MRGLPRFIITSNYDTLWIIHLVKNVWIHPSIHHLTHLVLSNVTARAWPRISTGCKFSPKQQQNTINRRRTRPLYSVWQFPLSPDLLHQIWDDTFCFCWMTENKHLISAEFIMSGTESHTPKQHYMQNPRNTWNNGRRIRPDVQDTAVTIVLTFWQMGP